ncbi:MAG: immunoglobulin domain-containing protein, partial [Verrucomicrobia bacterium]|nr:immunoglobulin domain-containing protein [Verrucomicrobiota bacterium]
MEPIPSCWGVSFFSLVGYLWSSDSRFCLSKLRTELEKLIFLRNTAMPLLHRFVFYPFKHKNIMMLNKSTVLCAGAAVMLSVTAVLADGEKPSITSQPYNQTVTVGDPVTFSVTATGEEPLSYQWNKDGTAINSATNSTYTINSVQTSDAGRYTVSVANAISTAISKEAVLTVNSSLTPTIV